jgi:hypothetical protein
MKHMKWRKEMMENYEVQVQQQAGKITCDFEGAKAYLSARLDEYRNVVFTEDSKKDAKATVSSLRKEKKAFADKVKEVRDEYMKPLQEFADKAKELVDMYDQPINFINDQVTAFEQHRIEEKKEQIKELYLECMGDMQEELPLNKIYNSKCKTYKIASVYDLSDLQIKDFLQKTKNMPDKEAG